MFRRKMTNAQPAIPLPAIDDAVAHHQAGRLAVAEAIYRQVLEATPGHPDALHLLGVVAMQGGNAQEAVDLISQSLADYPDNFHALNHLGEAYRALNFPDEAKTCFERALALKDDYFQAYNNLGNVYQAEGRLDIAMSCYQKAISINPDYAEAHTNLGNALQESAHWDRAIACYQRALALRPTFVEALANLGNAFKAQRKYDEAIPYYQQAVSLKPEFVEAHLALGRAFTELGEREQAIECFRRVCALRPEHAEARWGLVLSALAGVHDDHSAVENYRNAFICGLDELDQWFNSDRVKLGFSAVGSQQPFYLAYNEENNREVLSRYGALCRRLAANWQNDQRLVLRTHRPGKRVRVGLVSAHVHEHSVWQALTKGWCQHLDPQRFQLDIFHLGKGTDRETEFAGSRASRFVHGLIRPRQWVEAILAEPLDIIIYPEIGMDAMAAKLANLRLAPVQATTWGHPETSGLPTIDFYISAAEFEPEDAQNNYTEKLVVLPNLGCCYPASDAGAEEMSLADFGLDADNPLFICPGTPFKYTPQHDWIYAAIARELGRCQFVFFKYSSASLSRRLMQRLESTFSQAGLVFKDYVVELPWLSKAQFGGLMRKSSVYLDTIGFSGFNTAMQAIECGLPVVTREGRFLRGRLASGILRRLGLTELIADSEQGYVDLAIRLGRDRALRTDLRDRIGKSRDILYGDQAPVRALEEFLATVGAK